MKQIVGLTFFTILLAAACASAQETVSLRTAIDVAFNNIVKSGKFASVSNKYGLNSTKPACSNPSTTYPSPSGLLKTILDTGSITFCLFRTSTKPFWNESSNTGFLNDFLNGILDEWKLQYGKRLTASWHHVASTFGYFIDLQIAVNNGTCHASVDTTTVTTPRATLVDFACPYTTTTSGFLRGPLEAFRTNLTTLAALNDPSVKVGVLVGSVYDSPSGGVSKANRIMYTNDIAALLGVANQEVHAALMEAPYINSWLLSNPCNGCKYYDDGKGTQDYALFVKKTSTGSIAGSSFVSLILMMLLSVLMV